MVRHLLFLLGAAFLIFAAAILGFRALNGFDLLTGADPAFAPLLARHPDLEIELLHGSSVLYRVVDPKMRVTAFMIVQDDTLNMGVDPVPQTIRLSRCDRSRLPAWLPPFPRARNWTCVRAQGGLGTRWHVSFALPEAELEKALAFYEQAIADKGGLSGGFGTNPGDQGDGPDWYALQSYSDTDAQRMVAGAYYLDRRAGLSIAVLTFFDGSGEAAESPPL